MKSVYAFDLDGTIAASKSPIDAQMQKLLHELLTRKQVAVISGGKWEQFQDQLIGQLSGPHLGRLHCFPTCGTTYYRYRNEAWEQVYDNPLSPGEKAEIIAAFDTATAVVYYGEPKTYGDVIEDRNSQITFSALGQKAPLKFKEAWDPDGEIRSQMVEVMRPLLPGFDVRFGGTTSIDVTRKGHDKTLAINAIKEHLKCSYNNIVYFGDRIKPQGNDYAVYKMGIECVPVDDHIDCVWKVLAHLRYTYDRSY